ncbi:hypothetical protein HEK616_32170 [Streptomyces nigrescens]|uniref:Uncharacterized protein n=1 Tax=Streptomyces nigrescens TaxID=1920 RepID=A0ABM7ZTZ2_STRNI|nr:hypothetical protein HEK616_32170 [Streptomyces nigrescens]
MEVGAYLVADPQACDLVKPGEGAVDDAGQGNTVVRRKPAGETAPPGRTGPEQRDYPLPQMLLA